METRRRPITRTISKTPSILRLRWPVSERCELQRTELGDGTRRNLMSLPSQPHSPRDDYSPFPTVLAATNKCLAKSNKTRTARGATKKRFKQAIRRRSGAGYKTRAPSRAHHAEDSDHRDCAVADARLGAAVPATTATETAQPMVPRGWMGERLLNDGPSRERLRRHGQLRRDGSNGIDGDLRTSAIAASRAWSTFWAIRSK